MHLLLLVDGVSLLLMIDATVAINVDIITANSKDITYTDHICITVKLSKLIKIESNKHIIQLGMLFDASACIIISLEYNL